MNTQCKTELKLDFSLPPCGYHSPTHGSCSATADHQHCHYKPGRVWGMKECKRWQFWKFERCVCHTLKAVKTRKCSFKSCLYKDSAPIQCQILWYSNRCTVPHTLQCFMTSQSYLSLPEQFWWWSCIGRLVPLVCPLRGSQSFPFSLKYPPVQRALMYQSSYCDLG